MTSMSKAWQLGLGEERLLVVELPSLVAADELTEVERAIVERVVAGDTDAEIARTRGTSVRTVSNQLAGIFRKLGVRGRSELVARVVPRHE